MSRVDVRLANEAWEAVYRAQKTIERELSASLLLANDLQSSEYAVLYALTSAPQGLRISDLGNDVLLTQTGLSRLVKRLVSRGLIERAEDPADRRACRVQLTAEGSAVQRRVGAPHARHVAELLGRTLTGEQILDLRDIGRALLDVPAKRQTIEQPAADPDQSVLSNADLDGHKLHA